MAVWVRVLLAGDMCSDVELPLPFDGGLPAYLDGLDRLAPYLRQAEVVVPGPGRPSRAPFARLDADRTYLAAVLRDDDPADPRRLLPGMDWVHAQILDLVRSPTDSA